MALGGRSEIARTERRLGPHNWRLTTGDAPLEMLVAESSAEVVGTTMLSRVEYPRRNRIDFC